MKILKPGKVEMRKFVCNGCGCEFVANSADRSYSLGYYVLCPHCNNKLWWSDGEPYEEPTPTQTDRERLAKAISKYFCIGDSYFYRLTREKTAFAVGTMSVDDFEEFEDDTVDDMTDYLIANGVTFREG